MEPASGREPPALQSYVTLLRRRLGTIVLVTIVVTVTAVAISLTRTATYEATAQVLLQRHLSELVLGQGQAIDALGDVQTELEVMGSRSIEDAVTAELGHRPDVRLARVGETSVVNVTASSDTRDGAATDADTYAAVYVDARRQQALDDLSTAIEELQARVGEVDAQIEALGAPAGGERDPRRQALETRRADYEDRLDSLQVASNLTVSGGAQVVSEARRPASPVAPQPLRDGAVAFGIGLLIAVSLAFLLEQLNDRVRSRTELEHAAGLATIGLIPSVPRWRRHTGDEAGTADADTSSAAEAYRSLRTAVQFLGIEREAKVTQITSSLAAEGKTTTVANLGVALAGAGKRVVVVDSDLRHPRLPRLFGFSTTPGLTEVLLGESTLDEAVIAVPDEPGLAVLPSGQVSPNPPDLLVLRGYEDIVESLKASYDHVVIDTPPVLPVTDALIVAAIADIVLLVAAAGSSKQKDVTRSVELLRQVDAPLTGTVLNKVPTHGRYGTDYFYGYGYAPTRPRRRGWLRRMAPTPAQTAGATSDADNERAVR